jgi:hypothetical protein
MHISQMGRTPSGLCAARYSPREEGGSVVSKKQWLAGEGDPDQSDPKAKSPACLVEKNERLARLGLRGSPRSGDATCIHCGKPFNIGQGYIGDEASICDVCND